MKAWLSEFLFVRECFTGASGKPLYSYHLTYDDFQGLKRILIANLQFALHPLKGKHWSALYCLFIAERFRREYGSIEGDWSWEWAEKPLGCEFNQTQRSEFVTYGLESYWKRPIRRTGKGRNFIGSLFLEGGLPWPLIQSETHGFGRVIRKGLKGYHDNKASLGTTSDLVSEFEKDLPYTFRNLDTRQLLAGVIEQLMYLAGKYPSLKEDADPVTYLDKLEPNWRKEFPLPLNEANAKSLITDWLRDASKRQAESIKSKNHSSEFACSHSLIGELKENWFLQARVILPAYMTFPVDIKSLSSTRLEMVFYEGEKMIARGSIIYGEVQEDNKLKVRLPTSQVVIKRRGLSEPIILALMDNGIVIHKQELDNSSIDGSCEPLIFEESGDQKLLLASSSCTLKQEKVLVRLPNNASLFPADNIELKHTQDDGVRWIIINEETSILIGTDKFKLRLNHPSVEQPFTLNGALSEFNSLPNIVYKGWPQLSRKDHEQFVQEYIDGESVVQSKALRFGSFNYALKRTEGEVLFRRKFGVLPINFKVLLFPSDDHNPARLEVFGGEHCHFEINGEGISWRLVSDGNSSIINLVNKEKVPPTHFQLSVQGADSAQPVILRLPYPYEGARLVDSKNHILDSTNLILEDLIGLHVLLFSVGESQSFHLRMELINDKVSTKIHSDYKLAKLSTAPLSVNLFTYQNDMRQMLAALENQDAHIKLTIESPQRRLIALNIKRYNGYVSKDGTEGVTVNDLMTDRVASGAKIAAMLLSDPKQKPTYLEELTSQDVSTGRFIPHTSMQKDGPWLLYPSSDSRVKFRPYLFLGQTNISNSVSKRPQSLHDAARLYHPVHNPKVIDEQITQMGNDLDHSGWQYLDDLRRGYSHLPLSTFESWLSVSKNSLTLAVSILRLEVDEPFSERMRDELAIVWESIPLPVWSQAYKTFEGWLVKLGLPESLIKELIDNRKSVLTNIVPGFDYVQHYLSTGNNQVLTSLPPEIVLPMWRDMLCKSFEFAMWPKHLSSELSGWVEHQDLPLKVKALSLEEQADSVIYLPIFMAYVTSGKACISDLQMNSTLTELKFYIRKVSDFDRASWYRPAHALLTSYILNKNDKD